MIHAAWRCHRLSSIIQTRLDDAITNAIQQYPDCATDSVRLTALAANHLEGNAASLLRQESHEFAWPRPSNVPSPALRPSVPPRPPAAPRKKNSGTNSFSPSPQSPPTHRKKASLSPCLWLTPLANPFQPLSGARFAPHAL